MRSKNHFELRGFVGNQPEIKTTQNGRKVVNLRLATDQIHRGNKSGETEKTTLWHTVALWGKKAEITQRYINKGALIAVEGRIKPRSYQNPQGETIYTLDLVVDSLDIILNKEQ